MCDVMIDVMLWFVCVECDLVVICECVCVWMLKLVLTRSVGAGVGLLMVVMVLCVMVGVLIGNKLFDVVSVRYVVRDYEWEVMLGLSGVW